jgi:sodium/potassium-transporting ATPase subunit alpha
MSEKWAHEGERALAFAIVQGSECESLSKAPWAGGLQFMGLVSLVDPPRPDALETVQKCRRAGLSVFLVTGDHPATATTVARQTGIITAPLFKSIYAVYERCKGQNGKQLFGSIDGALVVNGSDMDTFSPEDWNHLFTLKELVFARTTPHQKLMLVRELQERKQIIAMTGDGVNDAAALKCADIGVAMGGGSQVAKSAATIVLLDDQFSTLTEGIRAGRLLFANLQKVVIYLLPAGSFSEIIPVLAWVFCGIPLALSTFQMIVICVGTDMIGSLALVHEQGESDIMQMKPRDSQKDGLLTIGTLAGAYLQTGVLESVISFFVYFFTCYYSFGIPPRYLKLCPEECYFVDCWSVPLKGGEQRDMSAT